MVKRLQPSQTLAAKITRSSSKQTYYTIRFFADRDRAGGAYQAYGYFRWVDDVIDIDSRTRAERLAFVERQEALLAACYRGQAPDDLCAEEQMLADLVSSDPHMDSGLYLYLRRMMDVMAFDANRRGETISEVDFDSYTIWLATAVTEAIFYFIGRHQPATQDPDRYLAVAGAHVVHMLRDNFEDFEAGYYNIPQEYMERHGIDIQDIRPLAYKEWVCSRANLAQAYFKAGRQYIKGVKNLRCRIAGFAYIARFEWMLKILTRDGYCLRAAYPERKSFSASLWMGWHTLSSLLALPIRNPKISSS